MGTLGLNAESLRQLGYIADAGFRLEKAARSVKRFVVRKKGENAVLCVADKVEECRLQAKAKILKGWTRLPEMLNWCGKENCKVNL